MNPRYISVRELTDVPQGASNAYDVYRSWLVVDTSLGFVIAHCGDSQSSANAVAAALNITPA